MQTHYTKWAIRVVREIGGVKEEPYFASNADGEPFLWCTKKEAREMCHVYRARSCYIRTPENGYSVFRCFASPVRVAVTVSDRGR